MNKYRVADLPHGAKMYYVKNKVNPSTSIEVVFRCGARVEKIPGLAHFTEHMFFTGTEEMTKDEISKKYFDFINTNAYTSGIQICFYGDIFTKELGDYINTVATMITKTTFSSEAVEKEKPVVLQEIASSRDKYSKTAYNLNGYNIYGEDTDKYTLLGTENTVKKIQPKDVVEFVKKYFVANNLEIFIASPMKFNRVKRLVIDNLLSKLPVVENFERLPLVFYKVKNKTFFKITNKDIKKNYVCINFYCDRNMYDFSFKRKFGLVLDMINNVTEGINHDLRFKKSLVYYSNLNIAYLENESILTLNTECDKENINEVIRTTAEYIHNLVKNGFTQSQLDVAKRMYDYSNMVRTPNMSEYFTKFRQLRYYDRIFNGKQVRKEIKGTTLDECNALMREVFSKAKVSSTIFGDVTENEIISKAEFKKLFK